MPRPPRRPEFRLNASDYKAILRYYNIPHDGATYAELRDNAQDILGKKMCRCIKKIQKSREAPAYESRAIAICRDSVMTKKKLKFYNFKCKQTYKLRPKKHSTRSLTVYKLKRGALPV